MDDFDGAKVVQRAYLGCQVCVPTTWTDDLAKAFADAANPCGTEDGWLVRRREEIVCCDERPDFVHVILDA
jgi:hypothetical protein